jgi:hypothetical protein
LLFLGQKKQKPLFFDRFSLYKWLETPSKLFKKASFYAVLGPFETG